MKLTFLGGAREVTGSCILVETGKSRFLVDCGMFQGGGRKRPEETPGSSRWSPPRSTSCSAPTPTSTTRAASKLVKEGFRGTVHCTSATADLLNIMLPDSGHIQEREAEWETRKRQRRGSGT